MEVVDQENTVVDNTVLGGGKTAIENLEIDPYEKEIITGQESAGAEMDITNDDRFPSANQPILRGSGSTQTLGSTPIFVANQGLTPLGILDKKDKALEVARTKRNQRRAKVKLGEADKLNNANYQESFDKEFIANKERFISVAKDLAGKDFMLLLGDKNTELGSRFHQSLRDFTTIKRRADEFTDKAANIMAKKESADVSVSDKTYNIVKEVQTGGYLDGSASGLGGKLNELESSINIDKYLNDKIFPFLEPLESKKLRGIITDKEYQEEVASHYKNVNKQANEIAKRAKAKGGAFEFDNLTTEEIIRDAIKQRIGNFSSSTEEVKPPSTAAEKAAFKKKLIDNRLYNLNVLKDPYKGGTLSEPTNEAKTLIRKAIGSEYGGRKVADVAILKGGPDKVITKSIGRMAGYLAQTEAKTKSAIKKDLFGDSGVLKGSKFNNGSVKGVISNGVFNEDNNTLTVTIENTASGPKKVVYNLKDKGFSQSFKEDTKESFPDKNDRYELTLELSAVDRQSGVKRKQYLDLTKMGKGAELNELLNTSLSEENKVGMPELEMTAAGLDTGTEQVETPVVDSNKKGSGQSAEAKAKVEANKEKQRQEALSKQTAAQKEDKISKYMKAYPNKTRDQIEKFLKGKGLIKD